MRSALTCVLICAVVVAIFALILDSRIIARLHAITTSGQRVTCYVFEGEGTLKISVEERRGGCAQGAHELRTMEPIADPEDISIEFDKVAEEFVIVLGKQRIRMKANLGSTE